MAGWSLVQYIEESINSINFQEGKLLPRHFFDVLQTAFVTNTFIVSDPKEDPAEFNDQNEPVVFYKTNENPFDQAVKMAEMKKQKDLLSQVAAEKKKASEEVTEEHKRLTLKAINKVLKKETKPQSNTGINQPSEVGMSEGDLKRAHFSQMLFSKNYPGAEQILAKCLTSVSGEDLQEDDYDGFVKLRRDSSDFNKILTQAVATPGNTKNSVASKVLGTHRKSLWGFGEPKASSAYACFAALTSCFFSRGKTQSQLNADKIASYSDKYLKYSQMTFVKFKNDLDKYLARKSMKMQREKFDAGSLALMNLQISFKNSLDLDSMKEAFNSWKNIHAPTIKNREGTGLLKNKGAITDTAAMIQGLEIALEAKCEKNSQQLQQS